MSAESSEEDSRVHSFDGSFNHGREEPHRNWKLWKETLNRDFLHLSCELCPAPNMAAPHGGITFRFGGRLNAKMKDQMERRFEILAACAFGGSVTAPLANAATGIVTEVSTSRAISRTGNPSASRTKRSSRVASL